MKETPEKNNKVDNQLLQEYLEKISPQEIVNEIKIVGFIQDKFQEIKINNDKLISYKELIYIVVSSIEKLYNNNIDITNISEKLLNTSKMESNIEHHIEVLNNMKKYYELYKLKMSKIELIIKILSLTLDILINFLFLL